MRLHHGADPTSEKAVAYIAKANGSVRGLSSHQRIGPAQTRAHQGQCRRDAVTQNAAQISRPFRSVKAMSGPGDDPGASRAAWPFA